MPVSSTPSRVALAPLNTNVTTDSPVLKTRSFNASSLPLTPSLTPKFSLTKSATSIVPSKTSYTSARKFDSFSDYKISNNRNVKADLAATKLKLRLQLAFYKLKVQKKASHAASPNIQLKSRVCKPVSRLATRLGAISKTRLRSSGSSLLRHDSNSGNSTTGNSPTEDSSTGDSTTKTVPGTNFGTNNHAGNFSTGANVNLQRPRSVSNPRLSAVAAKKPALKLYHIKPSSAFHNVSSRLPLHISTQDQTSQILTSQGLSQDGQSQGGPSQGLGSIGHNIGSSDKVQERLPPVYKILKTPIKASSKMSAVSASDETIDETADDSTLEVKKRDDFLGSSPLRHNFGTPNSFSVAKSLLQLGSGFY